MTESDALDQHCKAIKAFLLKRGHAEDKINQYALAIGQHIKAIKAAHKDWEAIVRKRCDLGRRSAYRCLALVDGTQTVDEQRASNAVANRKLRERKRASRDAQADESAAADTNEHDEENARTPEDEQEFEATIAPPVILEAKRKLEIENLALKSEIEELRVERDQLRARVAELEGELARTGQDGKPKRGRPKGSKNKPKPSVEAPPADDGLDIPESLRRAA
jgi:hypothetical protein